MMLVRGVVESPEHRLRCPDAAIGHRRHRRILIGVGLVLTVMFKRVVNRRLATRA